jgi:hypothetical protein
MTAANLKKTIQEPQMREMKLVNEIRKNSGVATASLRFSPLLASALPIVDLVSQSGISSFLAHTHGNGY